MFGFSTRPRTRRETVVTTSAPRRRGFFSRTAYPKSTTTHQRRGFFHRRVNPNRRAGGLKAALHNPNTSSAGRHQAKSELRAMGRGREAHVPLSVRIKHLFGIGRHRHRHTVRTTRAY